MAMIKNSCWELPTRGKQQKTAAGNSRQEKNNKKNVVGNSRQQEGQQKTAVGNS